MSNSIEVTSCIHISARHYTHNGKNAFDGFLIVFPYALRKPIEGAHKFLKQTLKHSQIK